MKKTDKEIIKAMEFIKEKHNGELPYRFGTFECAKMMALYEKYINEKRNLNEISPEPNDKWKNNFLISFSEYLHKRGILNVVKENIPIRVKLFLKKYIS